MDVAIVGIGLHPFGRFDGKSALDLGEHAAREALRDAGADWSQMQFAFGGSLGGIMEGETSAAADSLVSHLGLTGLQFASVANGCATAGTALDMAAMAIRSGKYDVGLAVGFDKHPRGHFNLPPSYYGLGEWYGQTGMMVTTQFFAMKTHRYMHEHGITQETLAKIAARAYRNGAANENAWRRKTFSEEEILASPTLNYPLTKLMICSPDEGAGAFILCRGDIAHRFTSNPIYLRGVATRTRRFGNLEGFSPSLGAPSGERLPSAVQAAAEAAFAEAGIGPQDVEIAQLQDSEPGSEVIHMAETGLCGHGEQERLVRDGDTEPDGRLPINTDGGLIANGEPIAASGMRQIYELALQMRGQAGSRQVAKRPKVGFSQVYGAPGVGSCTVLTR